jgi:peptide chain release factor 1
LTLYRLEGVLEGDLDEILNALTAHYQAEALKDNSLEEGFKGSRAQGTK